MKRHAMLFGTAVAATTLAIAAVGCSQKLDAGSASADDTAASEEKPLPVISQVYPGDANGAGAYVEIFNPYQTPIKNLDTYAVQWAAGDKDFTPTVIKHLSDFSDAHGTLAAGQHLHVKLETVAGIVGSGSGAESAPTRAAGKVAIVIVPDGLAHGCVDDAGASCADKRDTYDYVGWGASTFVPTNPGPNVPAAAPDGDKALVRALGGCQNTTDNSKDFAADTKSTHDLADAPTPCAAPDGGADAGDAGKTDAAAAAVPLILLNEIKIRQGAANKWGFTEIACTKETPLFGLRYVELDDTGTAVRVVDLSKEKCGTGPKEKLTGIVLLTEEGGTTSASPDATVITMPALDPAKKPSTFMLVLSVAAGVAPPVEGQNYDNGKAIFLEAWGGYIPTMNLGTDYKKSNLVWDSIAVATEKGAKRYAKTVVVPTADAISRPYYIQGTAPTFNDNSQWFGGALKDGDDQLFYDAAKSTKNIPQDVFALTPGLSNLAPDVKEAPPEAAAPAAPTTKTTTNPASEKIADSASSVCSMAAGPKSPGYGFLAGLALAIGAAVTRRKKR